MDNKKIKDYFTPTAWKLLSDYERKRYENLKENYEMMKSNGITAKLPQFMTFISHKRKRNQERNNESKASLQSPSPGIRNQRTRVKLFGVNPVPKSKKRDIEEVGDSLVTRETTKIKPDLKAVITFSKSSRKLFAQVALKSTYEVLKVLENIILRKEENNSVIKRSVKKESKNRYPKRNIQKKNYMEEDISSDDDFLHCDDCEDDYKGACPEHGPMLHILDTKVDKDDPNGAANSLPPFMSLGKSSLPKGGQGVWTEVTLAKGLIFGPYRGPTVPKDAEETGYAWQVWKGSRAHHLVEDGDPSQSNWMRYVNCAPTEERQNMEALQYKGKVFYKTYKEVLPHCELLVWYGDDYATHLGIDPLESNNPSETKEITGYPCNLCGALFSSSSAMEAHRKSHPHMQPDRKHKCPQCTYSTQNKTHLEEHLRTHTEERPHECPHCRKGFKQKSDLKRHLLLHTGEKPFSCAVCDRAFNRLFNLRSHEKTHTKEKSFRCTTCGRDFTQAIHLKTHERTHTLQRPYRCPHCDYRATQTGHLRMHVVSMHTRDFRHRCSECNKGFTRPHQLKNHLEKVHHKKQAAEK